MTKTARFDDYEPVADRLAKFHADHPQGQVITDITEERQSQTKTVDGTVIAIEGSEIQGWLAKATLYDEKGRLMATGWARQELLREPPKTQSGKANIFAPEYTSPVEVAETSAIGRALANAGYAAKRPSREEMTTQKRNVENVTQLPQTPHQKAWEAVFDVLGPDDAEPYFRAAMQSLGLRPGDDKLDATQAEMLISGLP